MFKNYLSEKIKIIVLVIIFALIFSTMSFLYSLPITAILYSCFLIFLILLVFFIIDFLRFRKKYKQFSNLNSQIVETDLIPKADTYFENEYLKLVNVLFCKLKEEKTINKLKYSEMIDFYSLWVHQVKSPIAGINLLLQDKDYPENNKLKGEIFKIERYTEIALNYLRLEDISNDLDFEKVKLKSIVNSVVKKYAMIFIIKNITLSISEIKNDVITDEKWFCFALEQIISNSLKYTKSGGKIEIYCENDSLFIKDNGIGIIPSDLPRIFEKGFTGYNGRMDKKATGLGLYLTKKTLDKLNHKIKILSDGKSGTEVIIDFKRDKLNVD